MPSRRAVVASLAAALGGCAGLDRPGDDATATQTPTPAPVPFSTVPPDTVPFTATVGLLPDAAASVRLAADDAPTTVGGESVWEPLAAFGCLTVDGTGYRIDTEQRGGGYENTYDVSAVDDPGNETVVNVSALPADHREDARSAIESGEYTFASAAGGYRPNGTVLAANGTYYAFERTRHADFGYEQVHTLRPTDDEHCPTLAPLALGESHHAAIERAHYDTDGSTLPAATAQALRDAGVGYLVVGTACYALPSDE
ncbi:hypothetical protein [Haloarcula litorea]|uniref:hypothetical protein n=1 Tax=Haloarcula litorea TaxID=3032579 RepID=UPI0023E86CDD|nr:hypothetical protein [Halomicroarcula sp. GDY20]